VASKKAKAHTKDLEAAAKNPNSNNSYKALDTITFLTISSAHSGNPSLFSPKLHLPFVKQNLVFLEIGEEKRKIAMTTHEIQAQQTGMQGFSLYLWRKTLRVDIPAELSDLSLLIS